MKQDLTSLDFVISRSRFYVLKVLIQKYCGNVSTKLFVLSTDWHFTEKF